LFGCPRFSSSEWSASASVSPSLTGARGFEAAYPAASFFINSKPTRVLRRTAMIYATIIITGLVFIYLGVALVRPEWF